MTECETKEIIKAFAFGFSDMHIAYETPGISVNEIRELRVRYAKEIAEKAGEVHGD